MTTLPEAVKIALSQSLKLKKSESCLIIGDTLKSNLARSFYDAASDICKKAVYFEMEPLKVNGKEPLRMVAELMKGFDVVLMITTRSLTHTKARREASKKGVRIASMPGLTEDIAKRALPIDYAALKKQNIKIINFLQGKKEVKVTTELGTNITLEFKGRKWGGSRGGFIVNKGDYGNLPEGEVYAAPTNANGVWFVDVIPEVGLVKDPVKIIVKDGMAVSITGKHAAKIKKRFKGLPKNSFMLAELGIGTNPLAKITGIILEDEKVLSTAHIALGNNVSYGGNNDVPIHLDLVFTRPTIIVDGRVLMDSGVLKV
ncbi:MAG: aminopeptidase [archaeon]